MPCSAQACHQQNVTKGHRQFPGPNPCSPSQVSAKDWHQGVPLICTSVSSSMLAGTTSSSRDPCNSHTPPPGAWRQARVPEKAQAPR